MNDAQTALLFELTLLAIHQEQASNTVAQINALQAEERMNGAQRH